MLTETTVGIFIKLSVTLLSPVALFVFQYNNNRLETICRNSLIILSTPFLLTLIFLITGSDKDIVSGISFFYPILTGYLGFELVRYQGGLQHFLSLWTRVAVGAASILVIFMFFIEAGVIQIPHNEINPITRVPILGGIHRDNRFAFWFNEANYFAAFLILPLFFSISEKHYVRTIILSLGILITGSLSALIAIVLSFISGSFSLHSKILLLIASLFATFFLTTPFVELFIPENRVWSFSEKMNDYLFLYTRITDYPLGSGFQDINALAQVEGRNLASGIAEPVIFFGWLGVVSVAIIFLHLFFKISQNAKLQHIKNGVIALGLLSLVHGPLLTPTFMFLYLISANNLKYHE